MLQRTTILFLISPLWLIASAIAAPISEFTAPYAEMYQRIGKAPASVLDTLLANQAESRADSLAEAQRQILISTAYQLMYYPPEALSHAQKALSLTDQLHQPWLYQLARLTEAAALNIANRAHEGLQATSEALAWAQLNENTSLSTLALLIRGDLYTGSGDFYTALQGLQQAEALATSEQVWFNKGVIASAIALVYEYRNENQLAIPKYQQAVDYQRQSGNSFQLSAALYGLGRAQKNIGQVETAETHLTESLALAKQAHSLNGMAYAQSELGRIDLIRGNLDSAEQTFRESLAIFEQTRLQPALFELNLTLANVLIVQKKLPDAKAHIDLAYQYIDPQHMAEQTSILNEVYAMYLAVSGDVQQAYEMFNQVALIRNQLSSQQSAEKLHQIRAQHEVDLAERETRLLEQQNRLQQLQLESSQQRSTLLILLSVGLVVILALLALLMVRSVQAKNHFKRLASIDSLTGLANRRAAQVAIQNQIDLAQRHQYPLSIAMGDIDFFKEINDRHGHAAGDRVLEAFGELCRSSLRRTDVVGRMGGEEFVFAFPHTELAAAKSKLHDLATGAKQAGSNLHIEGLNLTLSFGLTTVGNSKSVESVLKQADHALYRAKANGRDCVEVFDVTPS